jgi:uncharacterized protein YidB (DUF937 family)
MLESVIGGVLGQVFGGRQGGMSPLVKALLMLLLAKGASGGFGDIFGRGREGEPGPEADRSGTGPSGGMPPEPASRGGGGDIGGFDQYGGRRDTGPVGRGPSSDAQAPTDDSLPGSGFDDLSGMLGGGSGGGAGQSAARPDPEEIGGLGPLVDRFRQAGLGDVIGSWIGHGTNHAIGPDQLARALGDDTVSTLERESGMDRSALLSELSQALPEVIHRLTPQGRL